jgi:hypothetical protein
MEPTRSEQPTDPAPIGWLSLPPMRYQNQYVWFLFFASLDIMLTWAILKRGGTEVNPIARLVIDNWDLPGAIAFKFSLILVVITVCEIVGRRKDRTGRWLVHVAVVISAMPVIYSLGLLLWHTFSTEGFFASVK